MLIACIFYKYYVSYMSHVSLYHSKPRMRVDNVVAVRWRSFRTPFCGPQQGLASGLALGFFRGLYAGRVLLMLHIRQEVIQPLYLHV